MDHEQRMKELRARGGAGAITMFKEELARQGLRRGMVKVADLCAWDKSELWNYNFPEMLIPECEFVQAELLFELVATKGTADWRLQSLTKSTDPIESRWALRKLDFQRLFYEKVKAGKLQLFDDMTYKPLSPQLSAKDLDRLSAWISDDEGDDTPSGSSKGETKSLEADGEMAGLRPPLQQRFQEEEIVRVLIKGGYDPKAIPRRAAGKPGAKKFARDRLKFPTRVFDKAWERLRADGEIQDTP